MIVRLYYCLGNSPQYKEDIIVNNKAPSEVIRTAQGLGGIWVNDNTYVPWHSILKLKFEDG